MEKKNKLHEISQYLASINTKFDGILEQYNWSLNEILKKPDLAVCQVCSNHSVPIQHVENHCLVCSLTRQGIPRNLAKDLAEMKSFNKINSITLDDETILGLLIEAYKSGQLMAPPGDVKNLHGEEKNIICKHIIAKAKSMGKIPVVDIDEALSLTAKEILKRAEQEKAQVCSTLEERKLARDMKRRRQSYRAKNVHITQKSYTEIIREVLANQMFLLNPSAVTDADEQGNETEELAAKQKVCEKRYRSRSRSPNNDRRSSHSDRRSPHRHRKHHKKRHRHDN